MRDILGVLAVLDLRCNIHHDRFPASCGTVHVRHMVDAICDYRPFTQLMLGI